MSSDLETSRPVEDRPARAPIFHRFWGALLVVFGLWLALGVAASVSVAWAAKKPAREWIVEGVGIGVCVALLHLGYSLWMGSRRARMSAAALIGLGLLGFVVATVNGFPVNGLVGLVVFGFLGGVSLLLSRGAVR